MSQKEIFAIALKVFSLWFLCWLFINMAPFLAMLSTVGKWQNQDIPSWAYLLISLSFLIAGFIISRLLFTVSHSVLHQLRSDNDSFLSERDHKFIFQVSGLFFIVGSLTLLPSSLAFLFIHHPEGVKLSYFLKPLGYLLQLLIGLWLVVHPSWWDWLFAKLRGRA
jgi:hypothetical protein